MTVVGYSAGAIVAADFRLDDSRTDPDDGGVYVGKASNDLNAHAGHAWLGGPDPIDPEYGATRIKAETPESYSSPIGYSMEAHLHYFAPGSESLYATALVTSGNAGELDSAGMLAEHKEETPLWPDDDPEADRTNIEDNHYHEPE